MWQAFDKLVCINLEERPDRLAHARRQFQRVGIAERIHYQISRRAPEGGCFGCFQSHHRAIEEAYADPAVSNLVIFEDDLVFRPGWQRVIEDCAHFVEHEPDWEFLNLCGHIYYVVEPSQSCPRIFNGKTTKAHAVALSRAGMEKFLSHYPKPVSIGVDDVYMCLLAKSFGHRHYNAIIQEEELGTDNPWVFFQGMETDYAAFIQNRYIPHVSRAISAAALKLGHLPHVLRPWLVSNDFSENLNSDINIWRRNKGSATIPWRVGPLANLLVTLLGLISALRVPKPPQLSRLRLIQHLLRM